MVNPTRLNKAQRRKFLEYLAVFEATLYRPSNAIQVSNRKKAKTAQSYRNIKCACAVIKYYASFEKNLDEKPSFRKTRIYDQL